MPLDAPVRQLDGFVSVDQAIAHPRDSIVNVIGVVSEILPVKPSRGSDLQFAIQIQDQSVTNRLGEGRSLRAKWFIKHADQIPKIESIGDTVVLRMFKVSCYASSPILLRQFTSECIVLPSSAMPDPHFNDSYASGQLMHYLSQPPHAKPPTPEQQVWAISLKHTLCSSSAQPGHTVAALSRRPPEKFNLIKNVGPAQFYDLVVEVVRMFDRNGEIYVTDYTENRLLYRYRHPDEDADISLSRDGDEHGYTNQTRRRPWPGPFGQMTLQVKLWPPHSSFTFTHINEGEIIELKNVHIKMDRSGSQLEGAMHQDGVYPHRVDVISMLNKHGDARVRALQGRKESHMKMMRNREAKEAKEAQGLRKRARRKKQKEGSREKRAAARSEARPGARSEDPMSESEEVWLNSHVKSERPQDPTTRLTDIETNERRLYKTSTGVDYKLPFVNAIYKAQVRVVDFWPDTLEHFSKSLDNPEFNDISEEHETQSSTTYTALSSGTQRWQWHFCLLVEDAKQPKGATNPVRIPLTVFDKDAEYLLNLDATDLRKDSKTLHQLQEKLFILWGNLQELKSEGCDPLDADAAKRHSSKAFECCIKEAGTATDADIAKVEAGAESSYQRIYLMHGTTIRD